MNKLISTKVFGVVQTAKKLSCFFTFNVVVKMAQVFVYFISAHMNHCLIVHFSGNIRVNAHLFARTQDADRNTARNPSLCKLQTRAQAVQAFNTNSSREVRLSKSLDQCSHASSDLKSAK